MDPGSRMGKESESESSEKLFWVKILKFLNPGSGMEKIRIQDKHPGSEHCYIHSASTGTCISCAKCRNIVYI
jgi:hypothetical protein